MEPIISCMVVEVSFAERLKAPTSCCKCAISMYYKAKFTLLSIEATSMTENKSSLIFTVSLSEAFLSLCRDFAEMLNNVSLKGAIYYEISIHYNNLKWKRRIVKYSEPSPRASKGEKVLKQQMVRCYTDIA